MESVLEKTFRIRLIKKPTHIGFVVAKEQVWLAIVVEAKVAQLFMLNFDAAIVTREFWLVRIGNP